MKYYADVHAFHAKFNIPQPRTPGPLPEDISSFRVAFMHEELSEYTKAVDVGDLEGQLDALVDLVYVALGTALMHGFNFDEAWDRVQRANMQKAAGKPTGRHGVLDVHKPEGWRPPDLQPLVEPDHVRPPINAEKEEWEN